MQIFFFLRNENYAAFQNSLYDLANIVPTLAKFYHQASEAYEQACTRHISMIFYYQFERLFQFTRRIEDLMFTVEPEEIPFQLGLSKMDLRKMLKSSLSGVDKSIAAMYKKLLKNLTSEELLVVTLLMGTNARRSFLISTKVLPNLWLRFILLRQSRLYIAEMRDLLVSIVGSMNGTSKVMLNTSEYVLVSGIR
ncbi:Exocyst complex component SEC3A [Glycine soja]